MLKRIFILYCAIFSMNANANETIKIAISDFPPFEFIENGKIVGLDVEIVTEVLKNAGYNAEFISIPKWEEALKHTEDGKFDAIMSLKKSSERQRKLLYSSPIAYTQDYFFKKKSLKISPKNFDEIKSLKVGIISDYFYGKSFDNAKFSNLHASSSADAELYNLKQLNNGKLDLVACELSVCNFLINKYKDLLDIDYINSLPINSTEELYIAFSRNNASRSEIIVEKFNTELQKYIDKGKAEELKKKSKSN